MKKIRIAAVAAAVVLALGVTTAFAAGGRHHMANYSRYYVDADGDGICDNRGTWDRDGICANRGVCYTDDDGDGVCDNRGAYYTDADGDGVCDNYGTGLGCQSGAGHGHHGCW